MAKQAKQRSKKNSAEKRELVDQIDAIAGKLHAATVHIDRLHAQWITYLTVLSYAVVGLSFYQLQQQTTRCIQHWELVKSTDYNIRDLIVGQLIAVDAAGLLVGCLMATLLCAYLRTRRHTVILSHPLLLTANVSLVPALALYILDRQRKHERDGLATCLTDAAEWAVVRKNDDAASSSDQQPILPIAVVFQAVALASLWLMKYQRSKHARHIQGLAIAKESLGKKKKKQ